MLDTLHPPFWISDLERQGYRDFVVTVVGSDFNGVSKHSFLRNWSHSANAKTRLQFFEFPNVDAIKPDLEKTEAIIAEIDKKLERGSLDGAFYYLHLTATHTPWRRGQGRFDFGKSPAACFDAEMKRLDICLKRLLDHLKTKGIYDDSVIALLSDHGTGLGEHGRLAGFLPYEEQIRIPMLLKAPGLKARRSRRLVSSLDLAPSLFTALGLVVPKRFMGLNFLEEDSESRSRKRPLISFCAFQDSYAVIDPQGRYKLHFHRRKAYAALFDLQKGPRGTAQSNCRETTLGKTTE